MQKNIILVLVDVRVNHLNNTHDTHWLSKRRLNDSSFNKNHNHESLQNGGLHSFRKKEKTWVQKASRGVLVRINSNQPADS
jgi:hypothetical protein